MSYSAAKLPDVTLADADLAAVGRALGDPHRARFVLALLSGEELSAGELARRAGISSSLASAHLSKLLEGGLVSAQRCGRNRHYRLAGGDVARAVESLLTIAPHRPAGGFTEAGAGQALRRARTCYDHLAGRLGVELLDAFERDEVLRRCDGGWDVTAAGRVRLAALGLDLDALAGGRRPLLRSCQDWTERRPHVAGALGAAVATRLFDLGWIRRRRDSRALVIAPLGARELLAQFAIRV